MPRKRKTLIIFTRFPEPGSTKTRLIPVLGPEGAASLQRRMAEQAVGQAQAFCGRHGVDLEIHFQGGGQTAMRHWLGPQCFREQAAGTIGERMEQTFSRAFAEGRGQVVIIGTDIPGLDQEILLQAFTMLGKNDLVLGPAMDGGYYLIGLTGPAPALFREIAWGTPVVLRQTLDKARDMKVCQLATLHDIDRPEDLAHFDCYPNPE